MGDAATESPLEPLHSDGRRSGAPSEPAFLDPVSAKHELPLAENIAMISVKHRHYQCYSKCQIARRLGALG